MGDENKKRRLPADPHHHGGDQGSPTPRTRRPRPLRGRRRRIPWRRRRGRNQLLHPRQLFLHPPHFPGEITRRTLCGPANRRPTAPRSSRRILRLPRFPPLRLQSLRRRPQRQARLLLRLPRRIYPLISLLYSSLTAPAGRRSRCVAPPRRRWQLRRRTKG